ncbi:MAG: T9SS type A sorting domain-containing protein [Bacteroidetes bacterium]|nr:T9SS type A sorting domain-containing protein [Bacteroidota bacterium]
MNGSTSHFSFLRSIREHHCIENAFSILICIICVFGIAAPPSEAQQCYIQTEDLAYGSWFVRAVSDSTCLGHYFDKICYANYKTQEIYFIFKSADFFGLESPLQEKVYDILMFDSLLVVNWENGLVFRILRVNADSQITEIPSILDHMPLLKFDFLSRGQYFDLRKLRKVNDSILLVTNRETLYSFNLAGNNVRCIDSLPLHDPVLGGDRFDARGDTLVILAIPESHAVFYHITFDGFFRNLGVQNIDHELFYRAKVYYGHGNIYLQNSNLHVLTRTDSGFTYREGPHYSSPLDLLILPNTVAQLDMSNWERIDIYTPELDTICSMPEATSLTVLFVSNYGDKIFIARSNGIHTFIPDTTTLFIGTEGDVNETVTLWPNPSTDGIFNVSSNEAISRVVVTDMLGRIVHTASGPFMNTATLAPTGLTRGTYFVSVQLGRSIVRKRLTVASY